MNTPAMPIGCNREHMNYLDKLQALGTTNMFGAAPYLAMSFGLCHETAAAILRYWQYTWSERLPGKSA